MEGVTPAHFSFKRSDQAITLASKNSVRIEGEKVQIDPLLLFQRLVLAASAADLKLAFKYDLEIFPHTLFESVGLMHEPQKSTLAESIWKISQCQKTALPTDVQYVLDGGALLHRIPWNKGSTFSEIFKTYSDYVLNKYGEAIVVFDGYEVASTKDLTHMRRSKGKSGPIVSFTPDMKLSGTKDLFLSNKTNKQNFVTKIQLQGLS